MARSRSVKRCADLRWAFQGARLPCDRLAVARRSLEGAIERFAGCAVVISHDRWFLDRLCTHILAFEGNGAVTWFDGNYTQYEADRLQRFGSSADPAAKAKYRQLTR